MKTIPNASARDRGKGDLSSLRRKVEGRQNVSGGGTPSGATSDFTGNDPDTRNEKQGGIFDRGGVEKEQGGGKGRITTKKFESDACLKGKAKVKSSLQKQYGFERRKWWKGPSGGNKRNQTD